MTTEGLSFITPGDGESVQPNRVHSVMPGDIIRLREGASVLSGPLKLWRTCEKERDGWWTFAGLIRSVKDTETMLVLFVTPGSAFVLVDGTMGYVECLRIDTLVVAQWNC